MPPTRTEVGRYLLLAALGTMLLGAGLFSDQVYAALEFFLHEQLGLPPAPPVSGLLVRRPWYVMLLYGLLYCGVTLLIIHVYFRDRRRTGLAVGFYALLFLLILISGAVGAIGDLAVGYRLARRLIELTVSPMPVVFLLPVLSFFKV